MLLKRLTLIVFAVSVLGFVQNAQSTHPLAAKGFRWTVNEENDVRLAYDRQF